MNATERYRQSQSRQRDAEVARVAAIPAGLKSLADSWDYLPASAAENREVKALIDSPAIGARVVGNQTTICYQNGGIVFKHDDVRGTGITRVRLPDGREIVPTHWSTSSAHLGWKLAE